MSQDKGGYDTEDGVGVVYDARLRGDKMNCKLLVALVTTLVAFFCFAGFVFGFWFGEKNIIDAGAAGVAAHVGYNYNPPQQVPMAPIEETKHVWIPPIPGSPAGGIFPPPQNVFGAGNGERPPLSEADKKRLEEAKEKCKDKRCCREDDDEATDSSNCADYDFLGCLAADNACVWDCTAGRPGKDRLQYNREFKGVDRHKAKKDEKPQALKKDEDKNIDKVDPDLLVDTADECGVLYEFKLNEKARKAEREAIRKNKKKEENEEGGDGEERRRLGAHGNFTMTSAGEMNETLLRRLGVIGGDGRVGVTSWAWPYYKNTYVTFQTSAGTMRCSAALISPRHALTAGHCVSDGYRNFYWNWKVYPNFGAGHSREFSVYQAWVFNGWHYNRDWNWDIAILTLNIDAGTSQTGWGWFGFGWNTGINAGWQFDVDGYPGDRGTTMQRQTMYMDQGVHENLLQTRTGDVVGGNSGGPVWYTGNKVVYGIVSHETYYDRGTWKEYIYNGFARITKTKFDAMCSYIATFPESHWYDQYIS